MGSKRIPLSTILLAVVLAGLVGSLIAARFARLDLEVEPVAVSAHRIQSRPFPLPDALRIRKPQPEPRFALSATPEAPRNVVLILGDGMGLGHLSVVSNLLFGPAGGLALESAPVVGLVRTWAANDLVTGSAASASAISTGLKTERRVVSMQPDGSTPPSLFEVAAASGLATGLVTTSGLVDATPAAFLAHSPSRYDYRFILDQIMRSSSDVLIGGDFTSHKRARLQEDYLELVRDVEIRAPERWTVVRNEAELEATSAPMLAIFAPRPGHRYSHGPELARSAAVALDLLAQNTSGFLLVLECEETDEGAHNNDIDRVVRGLAELDAAVATVLAVATERADTLVLVTADHDTGVPAIVDGEFDRGFASVWWVSDDHTANWVPLFAFGPGASRFSGVFDNTQIGRRIADLLNLVDFPAAS